MLLGFIIYLSHEPERKEFFILILDWKKFDMKVRIISIKLLKIVLGCVSVNFRLDPALLEEVMVINFFAYTIIFLVASTLPNTVERMFFQVNSSADSSLRKLRQNTGFL